MTIFVSYTRADETLVRALRDDLGRMGRQVWLDHEIHGGELWWREIIRTIQSARVFVFALSQASWKSLPCRQEFDYARQLGVPVLPVQVGPLDNLRIPIMEMQIVDYRQRSADAIVALVGALTELTSRPLVLPNPLPTPPKVPFEYLYRIAELLGPQQITPERQESIIGQLRRHLKTEEDEVARADIIKLLREFRERGEITKNNSREIDEILDGVEEAGEAEAPAGGVTRLPATEHWRRAASTTGSPSAPVEPISREELVGSEESEEWEAAEPGPAAPETAGSEPAGSEPVASGLAATPPDTPESAAPQPVEPEPVATAESERTMPDGTSAPAWLRPLVSGDAEPAVGKPPAGEFPAAPAGSTSQWWQEKTVREAPPTPPARPSVTSEPKPSAMPQPPPSAGVPPTTPPASGNPVLAFAGAVLGAMGLPFLLLAVTGTEGAAVTLVLILTALGVSLGVVSATRREPRARAAVVIAAAGLLGVIVFAAATGFFS